MPTIILLTGFEHGVFSISGGGLFNSVTGSPAVQGTTKRSGNYALQISPSAATCYCGINISNSPTIMVGRLYFRFSILPSGADACGIIRLIQTPGLSPKCRVKGSDSKIYMGFDNTGEVAGPTISVDTWYRLDFWANVGASPGIIDWQIDGAAQTQVSTAITTGSYTSIRLGTGDTCTATLFIDDMAVSVTSGDYPIGAGSVIGLSPNADGTHNDPGGDIQDNDGNHIHDIADVYAHLSDVPLSGNVLYIKQVTADTAEYFEVNFADLSDAQTVNGARAILAYMSSGTSANQGGCIVSIDGGFTSYDEIWGNPTTRVDYSESSMFYKSKQLSTPTGGWSQDAVNALKVRGGWSNDINPVPYWENLMIEVDYVEQQGNIYEESTTISSTPSQSQGATKDASPSLDAFASSPVFSPAAQGDFIGDISLASIPAISHQGSGDFLAALTLASDPAVSMTGGRDILGEITLSSNPVASMAVNLDIFSSLILSSNPALAASALADFYSALTLASTPTAVMAAIADLFGALTLASDPTWTTAGDMEISESVLFSSEPAFSITALNDALASLILPSNPSLSISVLAELLAEISAVSSSVFLASGETIVIEQVPIVFTIESRPRIGEAEKRPRIETDKRGDRVAPIDKRR